MDLIRQCFEENKGPLTQSLIGAEFSIDKARQFLPVAASNLVESTQRTSVFQTIASLFSDSHHQLLRKIDIDSIARQSGMNTDQVTAGLHAIAPVLLKAFAGKHKVREPATANSNH